MSDNKLATPEIFSQFTGTECYYNHNGQYAYTDGINYLFKHINDEKVKIALMNKFIMFMNFRNPFRAFELEVIDDETGETLFKVKDEEGDIEYQSNIILHGLKEGTYKIFCYNYVILAASEY